MDGAYASRLSPQRSSKTRSASALMSPPRPAKERMVSISASPGREASTAYVPHARARSDSNLAPSPATPGGSGRRREAGGSRDYDRCAPQPVAAAVAGIRHLWWPCVSGAGRALNSARRAPQVHPQPLGVKPGRGAAHIAAARRRGDQVWCGAVEPATHPANGFVHSRRGLAGAGRLHVLDAAIERAACVGVAVYGLGRQPSPHTHPALSGAPCPRLAVAAAAVTRPARRSRPCATRRPTRRRPFPL
jgi:hypothetical protein